MNATVELAGFDAETLARASVPTAQAQLFSPGYTRADLARWMTEGIANDATDLHLVCGVAPQLRRYTALSPLSGALHELSQADVDRFLDFLLEMSPGDGDAVKAHFAEHGWADFTFRVPGGSGSEVTGRGNVYRAGGMPALALRFFHAKHIDLGFQGMAHLTQFLTWPRGLILLTGPTGSGKTTIADALIEHLNDTESLHIATLEDPIEYTMESRKSLITQRSIPGDALTFAEGLKSILRQDPDVILVGEIRDVDCARQAISAAETGHLVISTMHAGSAGDALSRIVSMFPSGEQERVRATLAGLPMAVINQALIQPQRGAAPIMMHELFHNQSPGAFSLVRDGQFNSIGDIELRERTMRHWDRELVRHVRAGHMPSHIARTYARDAAAFTHLLNQQGGQL